MNSPQPGELPPLEANAAHIDVERLTVPEITFLSRAALDLNTGDHPHLKAAFDRIDSRVEELARNDPEHWGAVYEAHSTSEDIRDRRWFYEGCLRNYVSIAPSAALNAWKRVLNDKDDDLRQMARHDLLRAFSGDEEVTAGRLEGLGINLHQAASLLIAMVQNDQRLLGEQDQV